MAVPQNITVSASVHNPAVTVLSQYGAVKGQAFEAAVRYGDKPPGTPLSVDTIREILGVGSHIAARVLRELTAAGLAVVERIKDTLTGRMLGRRTLCRVGIRIVVAGRLHAGALGCLHFDES